MQPTFTNNQYSHYQHDVTSPTKNVHSIGEQIGNWPNYHQPKSIFGTNEKHIVLFAYNKQKDENSPQEISNTYYLYSDPRAAQKKVQARSHNWDSRESLHFNPKHQNWRKTVSKKVD